MTWFVAHIIIGYAASGDEFCKSAWENVVILQADKSEEAYKKAEIIGRRTASIDDGLTINDVPAKRIFAGIRKFGQIDNPYVDNDENPLIDGCEITYSDFALKCADDLDKLSSGGEIDLKYVL